MLLHNWWNIVFLFVKEFQSGEIVLKKCLFSLTDEMEEVCLIDVMEGEFDWYNGEREFSWCNERVSVCVKENIIWNGSSKKNITSQNYYYFNFP